MLFAVFTGAVFVWGDYGGGEHTEPQLLWCGGDGYTGKEEHILLLLQTLVLKCQSGAVSVKGIFSLSGTS